MRFSRFTASLDWKRALVELVLIVAAVLIALGVDSWWQDRKDRQRERAYLVQLLADMRAIEARINDTIAGDSAIQARVHEVLRAASDGVYPPPDSLRLSTGYSQFRPLTGTYSALIQNGDLPLIRNDSLRFRIIAYAALIKATEVMLRHTEDIVWRATERVGWQVAAGSPAARLSGAAQSSRSASGAQFAVGQPKHLVPLAFRHPRPIPPAATARSTPCKSIGQAALRGCRQESVQWARAARWNHRFGTRRGAVRPSYPRM